MAAGKHTPAAGCADCHMPKRRTEDVVHSVATDHLIQRHKPAGDVLADRAEHHETGDNAYRGEVVLYYPADLPPSPTRELYTGACAGDRQEQSGKGRFTAGRRHSTFSVRASRVLLSTW